MSILQAAHIECVFFDLDDCLYKNSWDTMDQITNKAEQYCSEVLGLPKGTTSGFYEKYGSTVRGLVEERLIQDEEVHAFLSYVHDVPLKINADPQLRQMLISVSTSCWVFTQSVKEHAWRCLELLGVKDLFSGIIAVSSQEMIGKVGYTTKRDARCFAAAMEFAGIQQDKASRCLFFDDSPSNVKAARQFGWKAVLVGSRSRSGSLIECPGANAIVDTIHEVPRTMPELFRSAPVTPCSSTRKRGIHLASPTAGVDHQNELSDNSSPEDVERAPKSYKTHLSKSSSPCQQELLKLSTSIDVQVPLYMECAST